MSARQSWSGIAPSILISQIRSTVPFLFGQKAQGKRAPALRYLDILDYWDQAADRKVPDHGNYFELCLVAHFTTVGSFVPTDVDNQIRHKIWATSPDPDMTRRMAALVEEFAHWDILPVGERYVRSKTDGAFLSGLDGEWLGCATAAYASLGKIAPREAEKFLAAILANLEKQKRIYFEQVKAHDGIELMKCAYLIAHNLGDLDRVIDIWGLPEDDMLRREVYKAGHVTTTRFGDTFVIPGNLNKKFMALENHRHFALREPKALRKKREFLLPVAPFLDDWGATLAADPDLSERELGEILEALLKGYFKLDGPVGYARALAGFESRYRGGLRAAQRLLPAKLAKEWAGGKLRSEISVSKERFLEKWASYPFDRKNHY